MNLENFYSGFGILLVYFTLVWQNIRQDSKLQIENSKTLIKRTSTSVEEVKNQKNKLLSDLINPLNLTISIISITGLMAFYKIIYENIDKINSSIETIVLFSISFMHIVISVDLWFINISIIHKIFKLKSK